ncbi:hypothetical protein J7E68_03405 [Microbacterium sp. ISL-103]|uniref:hypothetical protein n=1 Tax=Microbacterium sp. ISL-103 TaxID=2819156 RepID=UPI001BEA9F3F|nr:hypothetical protein [Microbacterium sp. ISL-103]MBT2473646.1 hypothetical protein [Microbacterium sp. ISL-103]
MTSWVEWVWFFGGAVLGTPIAAAMSSLPAATGTGVSLRLARSHARLVTDWKVWAWLKYTFGTDTPKAPSSEDDAWGGLLLSVFAMYVVVSLYVQNVVTIAVVMFWSSVVVLAVTTVVFLVLWWRRVFDGKGASVALLATVPLAGLGSVVSYWLLEPPLQGVLEPSLAALNAEGIAGLTPYLVPLVLQILGALWSFILLFGAAAFCGANVSAALIESRAWGARWLWRFVFWLGRWTTGTRVVVVFCGLVILSVFSASGLAAEWIANLQESAEGMALMP